MPTPATIVLTNQFGETSINDINPGGTLSIIEPVAAGSVLANITGSSAVATAVLLPAFIQKAPAKTGITALSPLASDADLPTAVARLNAILAALKAVV